VRCIARDVFRVRPTVKSSRRLGARRSAYGRRVRTSRRAFERLVEYLQSRRDDGCDAFFVQHIHAPEQAQRMVERGREIYGADPEFVSEMGPVIGAHVGPGLMGVSGIRRALLYPGG